MPEYVITYDDWDFFVACVRFAQEGGHWADLSDALHSGNMAICVNGLPRIIHGTIH